MRIKVIITETEQEGGSHKLSFEFTDDRLSVEVKPFKNLSFGSREIAEEVAKGFIQWIDSVSDHIPITTEIRRLGF